MTLSRYIHISGIYANNVDQCQLSQSDRSSFAGHEDSGFSVIITKTRLYNFDPLKPDFYIVKLGFTGVYIIFLISARKHRLWVLVRTASPRLFLRVPISMFGAEI